MSIKAPLAFDSTNVVKKIPEIGIYHVLKKTLLFITDPLKALVDITKEYGDVAVFSLLKGEKKVMLNHPDFVRHVMKTRPENYYKRPSYVIRILRPIIGEGIFLSEGHTWQKQHDFIKPAFHNEQIRKYYATIEEESNLLILAWKEKSRAHKSIDIEYDLSILLLKIMIKTQFTSAISLNYDLILKNMHRYVKSIDNVNLFLENIRHKFIKILGLTKRPDKRANSVYLNYLNTIVAEIIDVGKKNPESNGFILGSVIDEINNKNLQDTDARDMLMNLLVAGFDTTAAGLTWTCYCMAENPEEQNKVYDEMKAVVKDEKPHLKHLANMIYGKMAIQEALRLYPPVWNLIRVSESDDVMCGYAIPGNSIIFISIYSLHRHPDFWERPDSFYPPHFEPSSMQEKSFAYIPFGSGKRTCIGRPMAMAEMQLLLPILLKHFEFLPTFKKPAKLSPNLIIKSKKPLLLKLRIR